MKNKIKKNMKTQWETLGLSGIKLQECSHPIKDCYGIDVCGMCRILTEQEFKGECPFYKSWHDVRPENVKYFPHHEQLANKYRLMKALSEIDFTEVFSKKTTISEARKSAGYKQAEVAQILGTCRETYRKKEANPKLFSVGEVARLAELFDVSISDMLAEVEA